VLWIKQYWLGRLKKHLLANDQANIAWFTIYSCSYVLWSKQYWLGRLKKNLLANAGVTGFRHSIPTPVIPLPPNPWPRSTPARSLNDWHVYMMTEG
jgi:hypothetical protein